MGKRTTKAWLGNIALLTGSLFSALLLAELASRLVRPISFGGTIVTVAGERIENWRWLEPGSVYRQISSEYDALTTITDQGHRVPTVRGNPDVVFIGDSFTFGWGLSDDETFVQIYCTELQLSCANLGTPGTGTVQQVEKLEAYLEEQEWRPTRVKLFILAMTASFSAGNDLTDNLDYVRRAEARSSTAATRKPPAQSPSRGLWERVVNSRQTILRHSNLVRLAKFYWGPTLRSWLAPESDEIRLREALAFTQTQLDRLDELSRAYGFEYQIYLVHPIQDIIRNTDARTLLDLERVAPAPIKSTAPLFESDPACCYFRYDGHINREGSRRIADWLISEDTRNHDRTG